MNKINSNLIEKLNQCKIKMEEFKELNEKDKKQYLDTNDLLYVDIILSYKKIEQQFFII
jgi:replication-associated recombination protein RarA